MSRFGKNTRSVTTPVHLNVPILVRLWQEDDVWNASAYDLNVSVFGNSIEEAKANFEEALDAHFEILAEMGKAKQTVEGLKNAAKEHGFYDRIPAKEMVAKFEIPSEMELCLA